MKNQIGDYAFLDKTSRSWHLWIGNPFCIGREIISLKKATEKDLIRFAGKAMKEEKKRFMKEFPDIKWKSYLAKRKEIDEQEEKGQDEK